jgi:2',3'-cyclic-nucleotide 2'-phosphodiesterase (5'-nucleotidase family)
VLGAVTGNTLVVDSGHALFRSMGIPSDEDRARASFIVKTMAALGTRVLAVGQRDLVGGPTFLRDAAKQAGVQLVSTNLRSEGKPVFPTSVVLTVGGVKVAFLAVTEAGSVPSVPGLVGLPTLEALKDELKRLPPRELTVVLATTGYQDALRLAEQLSGQVDLVLQSGESRGTQAPQRVKDVMLLGSGQRGQAVGKVSLSLGAGKGPFSDRNEAARDQDVLENLGRQLSTLDERLKATKDPQARKDLAALQAQMRARQVEQAAKVKTLLGDRSLLLEWLFLGADVVDDPALKAEVLTFEPSYAGQH